MKEKAKGKKMRVINISSRYNLRDSQISFVEEIVSYEKEHNNMFSHFYVSDLMKQIPVLLLSPEDMLELDNELPPEYLDRNYDADSKDAPPTDLLGYYMHRNTSFRDENWNEPIIALCPERIIPLAKNNEELNTLIAKVIIHEYAHAMMANDGDIKRDEFYHWMEDSLANMITLQYFDECKNFDHDFAYVRSSFNPYDFVKEFISKQPSSYKFGIELDRSNAAFLEKFAKLKIWELWRDYKNKIKDESAKENYLQYVKTNNNIDDAKLEELIFGLFNHCIVDATELKDNPYKYPIANNILKDDPVTALTVMSKVGKMLKYASKNIRDNKDIVIAAVSEDGRALEFASNRLQDDDLVANIAVNNDGVGFKYISNRLKDNEELLFTAIKQYWHAIEHASDRIKKDKGLILKATEIVGLVLKFVDSSLQDDKDVVISAVSESPTALSHASDRLKDDEDVVLVAVTKHAYVIRYASERLQKDAKILKAAASHDD